MYIRSYEGWEEGGSRYSYRDPGLADRSEDETQISSEIVNNLTDLVFFARHPGLHGRAIKGNRMLEGEWNKIKNQLLKPSSAGTSTGLVIDLTLPNADPQPDYGKTENELGVWEWAIISGKLPFMFGTDRTVMPDRTLGSYVSMISLKFDNPRLVVFIAKHLHENAFDPTKSREDRYAWQQTLLAVQKHAYVHLQLFRRAAKAMELTLQELLHRLLPLPTARSPLPVSKEELDAYLHKLGEFITGLVQLELWEKTCDWEKKDYPELSRKIFQAGAVFMTHGLKVKCAPRPDLPDLPVPPVPIRTK